MPTFRLQFPISKIDHWASKYDYDGGGVDPIAIGRAAKSQGYLTLEQFIELAGWKSERPAHRHRTNNRETVEAVTAFAFSTPVEMLRLTSLTLLSGVRARTASAILHFCHRDPYPLMDIRAFESLGVTDLPHDWASLWLEYVAACEKIVKESRTDHRTLDRALWAYSRHRR